MDVIRASYDKEWMREEMALEEKIKEIGINLTFKLQKIIRDHELKTGRPPKWIAVDEGDYFALEQLGLRGHYELKKLMLAGVEILKQKEGIIYDPKKRQK